MESYPSFTEIPVMPVSGMTAPTCGAYPIQPTSHTCVTQMSQPQFQPLLDQSKPLEASPTPHNLWSREKLGLNRGYLPADYTVYSEPISLWDSGISIISDPQSPHSSNSSSVSGMNYIASPLCQHEESPITTVTEQSGFPAPGGLVDIDPSTMIPRLPMFDTQPNHLSLYDHELDRCSGSQSDHNGTPEQQWSTPLPNSTASPKVARRFKNLSTFTSISKTRKSSERKSMSTQSRILRGRSTKSGNNSCHGTQRTFVCSFAPYGCESTFVSKNEWKRHVTSKHLQLGFYRCDVGKCSVDTHQISPNNFVTPSPSPKSTSSTSAPVQPNDFNRKDLFTQHLRRMHAPWLQSGRRRAPTEVEHAAFEESLNQVRPRCWYSLRQPPHQSHCGFCQELFVGEGSWDARMEHVGRHFERKTHLGEELEDLLLRDWALREGILTLTAGKCRLTLATTSRTP
ncbi:hypothetical protein N7448_004390 [Penicillium atrosanguineum]|uniref:C2H2-type domain-containing protein n=1 Tax=Penicillium atrosanguineum TaxID=1132637 RepID=A0A9W9U4S2_9EURO|nr:uncharacterized protein N7443_003353 [Penicillium atrosanguineum]KAJ5117963.1 hypothetical protein N7526_010986 [Penicillium atrosanguineum]KAJ5140982.1 hypothetical protein N7448_004390 [Penicillium atrosanguineum]KAJ5310892.1 hypothetical protein N7443_003353 [Penicillium atrosanguineum]KAJ5316416.1 hypothetical protein N7476_006723 [Penicillium atrosanguineum]